MKQFVRMMGLFSIILGLTFTMHGALVPGDLNTSFDTDGKKEYLFGEDGTDAYQYKALYIDDSNNMFVLSTDGSTGSKLAKLDSSGALVSGFGSSGIVTIAQGTPVAVIVDSAGRILVAGQDGAGSTGWIRRYTSAGAVDNTFGTSGLVEDEDLQKVIGIVELTNGSIVAATQFLMGLPSINARLKAYTTLGEVNTSFGTSGSYENSFLDIDDLVVDSSDNIYFCYRDASSFIKIKKVGPTGALVSGFGTSGVVTTDIAPSSNFETNNLSNTCHITLDNNANVVVAADAASDTIKVRRYAQADGASGSTLDLSAGTSGFTAPRLARIQGLSSNKIVLAGYENAGNFFVIRLVALNLALDTDFNTTGIKTYTIGSNSPRVLTDMSMNTAGEIFSIGYEDLGDGDYQSGIIDIVGDTNIDQVDRYPGASGNTGNGSIDPTFGSSGLLNLNTVHDGNAKILRVQSDGKVIVGIDDGVDTYLTRLTTAGVVDTGFGSSGTLTLSGKFGLSDIVVTSSDYMLVAGTSGGASWVAGVTAAGALDTTNFGTSGYASTTLTSGFKIAQQKNGRYLLAGYNGSSGIVQAYTCYGAQDALFASDGTYNTAVNSAVIGLAVDSKNRILLAYRNGNTVEVRRLKPNGFQLDTTFDTDGILATNLTSVTSNNDVKLVVHSDDTFSVVAVNGTAAFMVRRYSTTGSLTGSLTVTPVDPGTDPVPVLKNARALNDGSLLIVGYDSANVQLLLARVTSAMAVDTSLGESYAGANDNSSGVLQLSVGVLDQFNDVQVLSTGRLLVAGYDVGATDPYVIRLYDDLSAADQDQDASSLASVGAIDTTLAYNVTGTASNGFNVKDITDSSGHYYFSTENTLLNPDPVTYSDYYDVIRGIRPELTYFDTTNKVLWVAGTAYNTTTGAEIETRIIKLNPDGTKVNFSGVTNGVATISDKHPKSMIIAQNGYAYITGITSTNASWIQRIDIASGVASAEVSFGAFNAYTIAQQTSGRLVVSGTKGTGVPFLYAFAPEEVGSSLPFDPTFIYNGTDHAGNALAMNSLTTIFMGLVVCSDDKICVAYSDSGTLKIAKLMPDGSALDTTFGTSGIKTTTITGVNSTSDVQMVANGDGNLVVAAATDTTTYKAGIYNVSSGVLIGSVYTSAAVSTASKLQAIAVTKTNAKDTNPNEYRIVYVGYDNKADDAMIVGQLGANDVAQTSFTIAGAAQTDRILTDVTALPDGTIWAVGYDYLTNGSDSYVAIPYVTRAEGSLFASHVTAMETETEGSQGALDATFDADGIFDLTTLSFTTSDIPADIKMFASNANYYIAFNNSGGSKIAKFIGDATLDTSYATDGIIDSGIPAGLKAITYDAQGRTLAVGYNGTNKGWIYRADSSQAADTNFGTTGVVSNALTSAASSTPYQVAVQSMGRILIAGTNSVDGLVSGYDEQGVKDSIWAVSGDYNPGDTGTIRCLLVDDQDRVYLAYSDNSSLVQVHRLRQEGDLDTSYSSDGKISDCFSTNTIAPLPIAMALDASGKLVIAGSSVADAQNAYVRRFATNGSVDSGFNSGTVLQVDFGASVTVSDVVTLEDNTIILVAYDSSNTYIARITSSGTLDTSIGTAGIVTVSGIESGLAAAVNYDGRLIFVGKNNSDSDKPTLVRLYLEQYAKEQDFEDIENPAAIGSVDYIFAGNETNGVSFFGVSGDDAADLHKARALAFDDNNDIYVAVDQTNASNLYLVKFKQDGALDTSFAGDGMATISSSYDDIFVTDMTVYTDADDTYKKVLLAGYAYSNVLTVYKSVLVQYIIDTAALDTSFGARYLDPAGIAFGDLKIARNVKTTTQGRIILGGDSQSYDSENPTYTHGVLAAYTRDGLLDTTWGTNAGLYTLGNTTGLYTHLVDNNNKIVAAFKNGSDVDVIRVLADGSALDTAFNTDGTISSAIAGVAANDQIRLARDANNDIFVAARTSNSVIINRYDSTGTQEATGTMTYAALGVSSFTMASMVVTEDGKVLIAGSDNNNDIVIFRVLADLSALDTTFNSSGYTKYNVGVSATTAVSKMLVHPDGRIIVVGYES